MEAAKEKGKSLLRNLEQATMEHEEIVIDMWKTFG
jgi:hypothetical protein